MKKVIHVNNTGRDRPGMISLSGVSNRQAKRWMKKLYRPGMTALELAEAAYHKGAVDSIDQAAEIAYAIVVANR